MSGREGMHVQKRTTDEHGRTDGRTNERMANERLNDEWANK
jgi:hypothetical protein